MSTMTREELEALDLPESEIQEYLKTQEEPTLVEQGEEGNGSGEGDPEAGTEGGGEEDDAAKAAAAKAEKDAAEQAEKEKAQQAQAAAAEAEQAAAAAAQSGGQEGTPPAKQPAAGEGQNIPPAREATPSEDEKKLAELQSQKDKLIDDFEEAEVNSDEFKKKSKEIDAEIWALNNKIAEDTITQRVMQTVRAEEAQKAWVQTCDNFLLKHAAQYPVNSLQYDTLNAAVKREQEAAQRAGKPTQTADIIERAHQSVQAAFGQGDKQKAGAATGKPAREGVPGIGSLPPAVATGNEPDEFASLQAKMDDTEADPEELEEMMRKMTPAQKDRFLRGQK